MRQIPKIFLLVESSRAPGRALLKGIAAYARYHWPWSFIWETRGMEKIADLGPKLAALKPDAIVVRDALIADDQLQVIRACGIPAVVFGTPRGDTPGFTHVVSDGRQVGRLAAEHLRQCGFKNFAFCGHRGLPWVEPRRKSFGERLRLDGFKVHEYLLPPPEQNDGMNEGRMLRQWLISLPKPVGLMAGNDDLGIQVIAGCQQCALPIPEAVGVVAADNDEITCGLADPPLSSVAINFERAGYEAAQAIDRKLRGGRDMPRRILASVTHVVARRSTDTVAVEDSALAQAMRFIRSRAGGPVTVEEVSRAVGLSRRGLERRFRGAFRTSIQNEIRRFRTDQIAQMLVESQLPVNEIAETLRFPYEQNLARYFKAEKHMTPLQYRRRFGLISTAKA
jgi:LacI family transcriptional regulator